MTALFKLFRTATFRLSLLFLLFFGGAAAVAIGYIYWNANVLFIRQMTETVDAEIQGLAEQYRQGGMPLLAKTISERSLTPGNSIYLVTADNGHYISGNLKVVSETLWNSVGDVRFVYNRTGTDGKLEPRQAFAKAFRLPQGYRLLVGRDIEDRKILEQVIRSVLWGLGFMTLVGLFGGWMVSKGLLSRIDAVTAISQAIMRGDLSERIPIKGSGDELDRLSHNLNDMLDKIERLMQGLKEVSDNIAHDLKTPLNRLRNRVEAALHEGRGEAAYKEALERTIEESDDLIRTFNALLSIARLEAGASHETIEKINLSQVLQDVAELYEPVLEEKGLVLESRIADNVIALADRHLIGQAVANLIDNAMKYAAAFMEQNGKAVILALEKSEDFVTISVADHGPGIPEQDRERALKRFVRLEASRSQPGSGLGLSLVAAVARIHGGEISLQDHHPGLKVVIKIPLIQT